MTINVSTVLGGLALVVSCVAVWVAKKSRRSSLTTELMQQLNVINNSTAQYGIPDPYAVLFQIAPEDMQRFEAFQAVYWNHINLLYAVYQNRSYLTRDTISGYERWIKNVFASWIKSEAWLLRLWYATKEERDLLGNSFLNWLTPLVPVPEIEPSVE